MKKRKKIEYRIIKNIRNPFKLRKNKEAIKDKIIEDIRNLFELENEEENYYKPIIRVGNFPEQQLY